MPKKTKSHRELVDTGTDKRFVRRDDDLGQFDEVTDVGRSLAQDRKQTAKQQSTAWSRRSGRSKAKAG
jgi:hypothetical protein